MPVVNIRDDDGNVVDTVDIPVSGGGGGNYAPAKAIIETSPWNELFCMDEGNNIFPYGWEWKKYIDGTFWLQGWVTISIGEEELCYEDYCNMPFDLYSVSISDYVIYEPEDAIECFDDMEIGVYGPDAEFQEYLNELTIHASISREKFDEFLDIMGDEAFVGCDMEITLTGRWRAE